MDRDAVIARLAAAGFIAADEETDELMAAAGGDAQRLGALVARRLTGEPLAWITGTTVFCGRIVTVHPGVYVPRWHTELLAERAVERLPGDGIAIDLCTGTGAIARTLMDHRRNARVIAGDVDPAAVANARANGVDARTGDLFAALPHVPPANVIVASVPYVPTPELPLLQRDTFTFETRLAYDGGIHGTDLLERVVAAAPAHLEQGGALLLELGGDQAERLAPALATAFTDIDTIVDDDGDVRGVQATRR